MTWWIDNGGAMSQGDDPDTVYLCEGDEGDTIRLSTTDAPFAAYLRDRFNESNYTRVEADECMGVMPVIPTGSLVLAEPYTARQCTACKVWVYIADGPFFEDDPTKTAADYLHWEAEHATPEQLTGNVIGFPFFSFNDEPVTATKEER